MAERCEKKGQSPSPLKQRLTAPFFGYDATHIPSVTSRRNERKATKRKDTRWETRDEKKMIGEERALGTTLRRQMLAVSVLNGYCGTLKRPLKRRPACRLGWFRITETPLINPFPSVMSRRAAPT